MPVLDGKLIVTTQPADQAGELLDMLEARGARVLNFPMIRTRTLEADAGEINDCLVPGNFRILVFTSKKGVRGFFNNLNRLHEGKTLPDSIEIAAIGRSTLSEVEKYGYKVQYLNPGTNAEDFAAWMMDDVIGNGDRLLLALGTNAPEYLQEVLSAKAVVTRINVYETIPVKDIDEAASGYFMERKVDMCIFTSPSCFYNYLEFFSRYDYVSLAAIGKTTAAAIRKAGYKVDLVAPYPSGEALADAIENFYS